MIQIFITGGTFDKEYNYITGDLSFMTTHIPEMLKRGRCSLDIEVETIMMKDSLEMNLKDRKEIARKCIESKHQQIIVTHGTDTMVDTAKVISEENKAKSKTIVLTGAMIPYTFGVSSDGFFNLGSALSFVQILEPGVYITMNGRYFSWNNVQKNYNTGIFERLVGEE
ncbi:asparaginase domain-containing protein [Membranihabitans maritimus]|uniref:asparaginase domain-containing protein n=1 Tax=Membranihabitans maritimus TaxID=2904244 RepID=UPI001F3CC262|nr:asparaginase domain-containing protein [Membranihabitans maritimus]